MTPHDTITDRLSDYVDGELPAAAAADVERHLTACPACRAVADDLRAISAAAPRLPHTAPRHDLWAGVAARIAASADQRVVPFGRPARRFSFTLPQLAAAGIALMVLSGSAVYLVRSPDRPLSEARMDVPAEGERHLVAPAGLSDPLYENAVADLEAALEQGRSRLDPGTVKVLEQNLQAIDQAIEQSRRALEADPANAFLNRHLVSARHRKLALLRTATALTTGS